MYATPNTRTFDTPQYIKTLSYDDKLQCTYNNTGGKTETTVIQSNSSEAIYYTKGLALQVLRIGYDVATHKE